MSKRKHGVVDYGAVDALAKHARQTEARACAPSHFCKVLDWLYEVCRDMELEDSTFVMACHLFSRFLAAVKDVKKERLQLYGAVSLAVAHKVDSVYQLPLSMFVEDSTDRTFTVKEGVKAEVELLRALDWSVTGPTSLFFLLEFDLRPDVAVCASALALVACFAEDYATADARSVAAACVRLAHKRLGGEPPCGVPEADVGPLEAVLATPELYPELHAKLRVLLSLLDFDMREDVSAIAPVLALVAGFAKEYATADARSVAAACVRLAHKRLGGEPPCGVPEADVGPLEAVLSTPELYSELHDKHRGTLEAFARLSARTGLAPVHNI